MDTTTPLVSQYAMLAINMLMTLALIIERLMKRVKTSKCCGGEIDLSPEIDTNEAHLPTGALAPVDPRRSPRLVEKAQ